MGSRGSIIGKYNNWLVNRTIGNMDAPIVALLKMINVTEINRS